MKRRGLTAAGTQRWYCIGCRRSYIWKNPSNTCARQKVWFERWLLEGYTVRQLAAQSGHHPWKIQQIIRYWLDRPPVVSTDLSVVVRILVDGTFLDGRRAAALIVMDADCHEVIFGGYGIRENPFDLHRTFFGLKQCGLAPESATIDGNPALFLALVTVWPEIHIQRCLVHIQRQGLSWCRRNPIRLEAKRLRTLFLSILSVQTPAARDQFLDLLSAWNMQYGERIEKQGERGWVASDLRRARSMILRARPFLFLFLDDPKIPASSNAIEGYFGRMKEQYRRHRGLAKKRREAFFQWYFHLRKR